MSSVTPITGAVLPAAEIKTAAKTSSGIDFSQILAESLEREVTQGAITATGGSASQSSLGGYTGTVSGGGIEQLLLAAASSGEVSDAQLALFMLCTMMQGGSESASSPYLSMMAQMLSQLSGDTGSLRAEVMASGYDAYTKNTLDFGVFGAAVPQASGDGLAALPVEEWKPTVPAVVNTAGDRSPENLRAAVDQFDVENAERYRPHRNGSDTYCNIYVWDVTSALGAEIPHYVDSQTGAPRTYPDIQGATEQGAIAMERWLETDGASYGWKEVNAETAQAFANAGYPAVTTSKAAGHVQMVVPSESGGYDEIRGVAVAQAGARVYNYTYLSNIYGAEGRKSVRYFVHET